MVIIHLSVEELLALLGESAQKRGISINMLIDEIVNKYFPSPHIMDKEAMAQGYKEMGEINLSIANGTSDNDKTR